jgi:hypothetical protein
MAAELRRSGRPVLSIVFRDHFGVVLTIRQVNRAGISQPVYVALSGQTSVQSAGRQIPLSAAIPEDTKSITEPSKISPITSKVDGLSANFSGRFPRISSRF